LGKEVKRVSGSEAELENEAESVCYFLKICVE